MKERMKKEAIKRLKMIIEFDGVIEEFEKENVVNVSENGGFLYWADDEQQKRIKEFEEQNNAIVYHAIKTYSTFGILLSLFYVSNYEEEWESDVEMLKNGKTLAYVINEDAEYCSEFGSIGFRISGVTGGLVRTW